MLKKKKSLFFFFGVKDYHEEANYEVVSETGCGKDITSANGSIWLHLVLGGEIR